MESAASPSPIPPELEIFANDIQTQVSAEFLRNQRFSPSAFLRLANGKVVRLGFSANQKDALIVGLRRKTWKLKAQMVALVLESWLHMRTQQDDPVVSGELAVSESPRRQEALMVHCENRAGGRACWVIPIVRTNDRIELGETKRFDEFDGRFSGFFV